MASRKRATTGLDRSLITQIATPVSVPVKASKTDAGASPGGARPAADADGGIPPPAEPTAAGAGAGMGAVPAAPATPEPAAFPAAATVEPTAFPAAAATTEPIPDAAAAVDAVVTGVGAGVGAADAADGVVAADAADGVVPTAVVRAAAGDDADADAMDINSSQVMSMGQTVVASNILPDAFVEKRGRNMAATVLDSVTDQGVRMVTNFSKAEINEVHEYMTGQSKMTVEKMASVYNAQTGGHTVVEKYHGDNTARTNHTTAAKTFVSGGELLAEIRSGRILLARVSEDSLRLGATYGATAGDEGAGQMSISKRNSRAKVQSAEDLLRVQNMVVKEVLVCNFGSLVAPPNARCVTISPVELEASGTLESAKAGDIFMTAADLVIGKKGRIEEVKTGGIEKKGVIYMTAESMPLNEEMLLIRVNVCIDTSRMHITSSAQVCVCVKKNTKIMDIASVLKGDGVFALQSQYNNEYTDVTTKSNIYGIEIQHWTDVADGNVKLPKLTKGCDWKDFLHAPEVLHTITNPGDKKLTFVIEVLSTVTMKDASEISVKICKNNVSFKGKTFGTDQPLKWNEGQEDMSFAALFNVLNGKNQAVFNVQKKSCQVELSGKLARLCKNCTDNCLFPGSRLVINGTNVTSTATKGFHCVALGVGDRKATHHVVILNLEEAVAAWRWNGDSKQTERNIKALEEGPADPNFTAFWTFGNQKLTPRSPDFSPDLQKERVVPQDFENMLKTDDVILWDALEGKAPPFLLHGIVAEMFLYTAKDPVSPGTFPEFLPRLLKLLRHSDGKIDVVECARWSCLIASIVVYVAKKVEDLADNAPFHFMPSLGDAKAKDPHTLAIEFWESMHGKEGVVVKIPNGVRNAYLSNDANMEHRIKVYTTYVAVRRTFPRIDIMYAGLVRFIEKDPVASVQWKANGFLTVVIQRVEDTDE